MPGLTLNGAFVVEAPPITSSRGDATECPAADVIRPHTEVSDPVAALLGIPFDTTTLMRPGARFGPAGAREALSGCLAYDPNWGVDLAAGGLVADVGDVDVIQTDVDESWRRISETVRVLAASAVPLVIVGGDHGIAFPIMRGLTEAEAGHLGLVNLDAHFDFRLSRGGEITSAMPFRFILERLGGSVRPQNFVEMGVGGWRSAARYSRELSELGAHIVTARALGGTDAKAVVDDAFEQAAQGTRGTWLSVDVDAIDGAYLGGTAAPGIAGLSPMQVLEIVFAFGLRDEALGIDIVELAPIYDSEARSQRLVAAMILTFLAGCQLRRRSTP